MEHKFKIGDKVRCINSYFSHTTAGKIYTIKDVSGRGVRWVYVQRDDINAVGGYAAENFELVQPASTNNWNRVVGENQEGFIPGTTDVDVGKPVPEYTGGSSSYYKVNVGNPVSGGLPYAVECQDVIEALDMSFSEGNIFKAIWRICAAKKGKAKKGYEDSVYDLEKIIFFAQRELQIEKMKRGE